ncbi:MAG: LAGLIDADG family homing endonuclease [Patescibacteria group bacterium]
MNILPDDYIAGLVDGEGCFSVSFRRDAKKDRKNSPSYFRWHANFSIVMRHDDHILLESVKETLGVGNISYTGSTVRYQVQNTDELVDTVAPFFTRHKLYGKKANDFELWKEAVAIIKRNKRKHLNQFPGVRGFVKVDWNDIDLKRLDEIRDLMKEYKSERDKAFKWK